MPAGTFGFWPAGMKHFAWAKGDTVVQVHGVGPWGIEYLNPADDPRKKSETFAASMKATSAGLWLSIGTTNSCPSARLIVTVRAARDCKAPTRRA